MITNNSHPLPAFHFRVLFSGLDNLTEDDSNFESVTGIGGSVTSDHLLQDQHKPVAIFQPVVLRRAVTVPAHSILRHWVIASLHHPTKQPLQEVKIEVLTEERLPSLVIVLKDVYVANWALGELHAQNSKLLMEEISLGYRSVDVF